MRGRLARALAVAAVIAAVLGMLQMYGVGLPLLLTVIAGLGCIAWATPWLGARLLDSIILEMRSLFWARLQGSFHSFGGVPLQIQDDGRNVWVGGDGLQRVLGRRESDEVLSARHSGHSQRSADGRLMLRVDAVVRHLATMPGRDQPRVQRLRRYFEREVLYPASQRRERR